MTIQKRKKRKTKKREVVDKKEYAFLKEINIQCRPISEWSKIDTIIIVVVTFIGLLLRVYGATTLGLWMDELQTYNDARKILSIQFLYRPHFLSFLFVRAALALGEHEFILRLPSFLFGIFSIPLIYFFGWRFIKRETAIVTAILVTLSPYHIQFSQEARYYTEMLCFSLLTVYFGALFLRTRNIFYLFLSLLWGIANIGIHPTTYVLLFTVILFVAIYLLAHVDFPKVVLSLKKNRFSLVISIILITTMLIFFESTAYPGKLSSFWRVVTQDVKYNFVDKDGVRMLRFSIPPQSTGFQLNSRPVPIKNMNSIYFSVWAKSVNMPNHSVNVMLNLFDKEGRLIRRQWLNVVGLTGSANWTQLKSLRFIPHTANFFVISISLYRNGSRPGKSTEYLFLRSPSFSPFKEKVK